MRNSIKTVALGFAAALCASAQPMATASSFDGSIAFDASSPVAALSSSWKGSTVQPRGGALVIDVHASLVLKNIDTRRIRGVTLVVGVGTPAAAAGGKGSVSLPTLDIGPGESFPAKIDLNLLRPFQQGGGPLVEVKLDGVLFDDLSFWGPNQLKSRRALTIWELEARRDRQHFRNLLERAGSEGLQRELIAARQLQAERRQFGVQMVRGGRITNTETEKHLQFAFLQLPDAPVEALAGSASVSGNEARKPWIEVRNKSPKSVSYVEMGWVVKDANGKQFMAGSVSSDAKIASGQKAEVTQDTLLRFTGSTMATIDGMSGFVHHVEFDDGKIWIPSREAIAQRGLSGVLAPSPEEQRLVTMYQTRGLQAVIEDLKRNGSR